MNIKQVKESLPFLFEANIAACITGHHGVGKSQSVAQFCNETSYIHPTKGKQNWGFVDLRLGTMDVGDLLGLPDFITDGKGNKIATSFIRPEWFPTDPDSKGIIFLDEMNRARRDILQSVFQLVLDRKIHQHTLPKGWFVVSAVNPNTEDYIVTDIGDKAFLDRFCHIKLTPTAEEFFDFAKSTKVDQSVVRFLREQPKLLQADLEAFDVDVKPSRRSWIAVDRLVKANTPINLLKHLVAGLVGTTAATAYIKSLSESDKPITGKDVVDDYDKYAKKIKEYSNAKTGGRQDMLKYTCDSLYEEVQGMKDKPTKEQGKNIQAFLKAIPKDLSFDLCRNLYLEDKVRDLIDKDEELLNMFANARNMKLEDL